MRISDFAHLQSLYDVVEHLGVDVSMNSGSVPRKLAVDRTNSDPSVAAITKVERLDVIQVDGSRFETVSGFLCQTCSRIRGTFVRSRVEVDFAPSDDPRVLAGPAPRL